MRPVRDSQPRRRRRLELEVLQLVANAIGVDRFDLIGASFGAPLAVRWAARKPESVSRLILYCGWVGDVVAAPASTCSAWSISSGDSRRTC